MSLYEGLEISDYVVAAMCGCWKRESGVNPGIWESLVPSTWDHQYEYDNIGGFGLGQWTNVGSPYGRLWNLHTYVTDEGFEDGNGDGQLEFVVHENYWTPSGQARLGYQNLTEFLTSSSINLSDLVWDFLACWEGVPGDAYQERLTWAQNFYNYIQEHKNDDTTWEWISGNRYLSESEMCNNVMVVYNYVGGHARFPLWLLFINKDKWWRKSR